MVEKTVLAIDPGTSKCGLALVQRNSEHHLDLLHRAIVPIQDLEAEILRAQAIHLFSLAIVGGGTGSDPVVHLLRERFTGTGLLIVDEKDTSMQARERYWENYPRRGWRKLLPSSLQVPPRPIDDFVAFILAERVLLES